jgi:hypothetical protein
VEAEELKGEKGAGTLRRDRNFTNGDRLSASAGIRIPNFGDACFRMMSAPPYN